MCLHVDISEPIIVSQSSTTILKRSGSRKYINVNHCLEDHLPWWPWQEVADLELDLTLVHSVTSANTVHLPHRCMFQRYKTPNSLRTCICMIQYLLFKLTSHMLFVCLFVCFLRAVISAFGLTVLLNTFMFTCISCHYRLLSNKWLIDNQTKFQPSPLGAWSPFTRILIL